MATCTYCGSQIPDDAKFCTACGAAQAAGAAQVAPNQPIDVPAEPSGAQQPYQQPQQAYQPPMDQQAAAQPYQQPTYGNAADQQPYQQQYQQPNAQAQPTYAMPTQQAVNDSGSIGWGILGFLIPIVGIVLYFVWRNTKPKSGKVALIGALISIAINFVYMFSTGAFA